MTAKPFSFSVRMRLAAVVILFSLLVEASFRALIPLSIRFLIDRVLATADHQKLFLLALVLLIGAAVAISTGLLRDFLSARMQSRLLGEVRQNMFEHLQRTSFHWQAPAFQSQSRTAELLERFTTDFDSLDNTLAAAIPWGFLPLIQALLGTSLMLWLDWRGGLVGFLLWPWILLAPQTVTTRIHRASEDRAEEEQRVLGILRENLTAQAVIRAFSLEQMGLSVFRKRNDLFSKTTMRAGLLSAFLDRFTGAGIIGIQIVLLILSASLAIDKQITVGTLVALQILVIAVGNGLSFMIEYLPSVSEAKSAWDRIRELMQMPESTEDPPGARYLPPLATEIIFSHVDYSYDGERHDLEDIKARIPRGTHVAFVGPSGAGKTTMLNLLMRFHDPTAGLIAIDGHDLRSVSQSSLRARMGVVLQENFLFNISVRENIRIGKPEASEEAAIAAARTVGLHEFIMTLPQGYGTLAGDQGVRFSLAQMQRLAIARAILRDPEILLLDEATSALDPMDEAEVNKVLREVGKGRTVISVTHRLSTAADADYIFVFDQGRIVEEGSHFELLSMSGFYANLWRKQNGFTFSADGRHVDVDAQRLKAFPILENLTDNQLVDLAPYFATETFQPGREIVRQNDPGDKFYIIARGKVEVWRMEEQSGATRRVAVLQDGDFFGEITLITGFPRTATVRALTVCTCIALERGQFNRMLEGAPELRRRMSEEAIRRLRESSKAMTPAAALAGL